MDKLVVVNPSTSVDIVRSKPMPSSLFGYLCAERAGRDIAPWLLGVSLLASGVEDQMTFFFEELSRRHDLPSPGMVGGSAGLRQTVYGRIGRLMSANFASREPEHVALDLIMRVVRGQLPGPDELLDAASERLARMSNSITTEVRRHIDVWRQRITAYLKDEVYVKVEVPSDLDVAGPVATILCTHFPEKVFVTYSSRADAAWLELRGPTDGPDVLAVVEQASEKVDLHAFGGSRSSAYVVLHKDKLEDVLDAVSSKFDPDWDDED